jgi:hypothetical protein
MTVSMWVNMRGNSTNTAILASDANAFQAGWDFEIGANPPASTSISLETFQPGVGVGQGGTTTFNADHNWVMVAATFNGANNFMRVYGGTLTTPMAPLGPFGVGYPLHDNTGEFLIGNLVFSPPAGFKIPAWIDDVRVYDTALSTSDLEAIRQADLPEPSSAVILAAGCGTWGRRRPRRISEDVLPPRQA